MTLVVDVALFAVPFVLSLFVFAYFFNRFSGSDETPYYAAVMHEINTVEAAASATTAAAAQAMAAGVA
jgi:hypothetical protein